MISIDNEINLLIKSAKKGRLSNLLDEIKNEKFNQLQKEAALELCCLHGRIDCIMALLDKGIKPTATAKVYACKWNMPEVLKELNKHNNEWNCFSKDGDLPLSYAIKHYAESSMFWLLENGADPLKVSSGITPLEIAKRQKWVGAAIMLEKVGKELDLKRRFKKKF